MLETGFASRIDAVREGQAGVAADEIHEVFERLLSLTAGQLKALRSTLVERPPHPMLKQMRHHPAIKGAPTAEGLLAILTGRLFGQSPTTDVEHVGRAAQALDLAAPELSENDRAKWSELLSSSGPATVMTAMHGAGALALINVIGIDGAETIGHPFVDGLLLISAGQAGADGFKEIGEYFETHGAAKVRQGLAAVCKLIDQAEDQSLFAQLVKTLGFSKALDYAKLVTADPHGAKCYVHANNKDERTLVSLVKDSSFDAASRKLKRAGAHVHSFAPGNIRLHTGARWPKLEAAAPQARVALRSKLGLGDGPLSLQDQSKLSRAMKAHLQKTRPDLLRQLGKELSGRRFIAKRYYDELYEAGVRSPEVRYSVPTYEAWQIADRFVLQKAKETRGRPLKPGEFTQIMQAAHKKAGVGVIEAGQTKMGHNDLGRLRSRAEDHARLGDGLLPISEEVSKTLDENPFLSPEQTRWAAGEDGKIPRTVNFARGEDVPRFVRELDEFIRGFQGTPQALAAEVHFRIVSVHPFLDGNGRVAKLMVDFLLAREGIETPVWQARDVLKNRAVWQEAVKDGVKAHLEVVGRYFDASASSPA